MSFLPSFLRPLRRAFTCALAVVAAVGAVPAAPAGAATRQPVRSAPTPQLIAEAVARGEMSRAQGALELARAVLEPERADRRYRSDALWSGTTPLLRAYRMYEDTPDGPERTQMSATFASPVAPYCGGSEGPLPHVHESARFRIEYNQAQLTYGLTIQDYANELEAAWSKQAGTSSGQLGWARPPLKSSSNGRYHVRIADLGEGIGGYVTNVGTHAGRVGDNPNTSWTETDAQATCMVLNSALAPGSGDTWRRRVLRTIASHEFKHAIQFGYGVLFAPNAPSDLVIEATANWMAEETLGANAVVSGHLWPTFSMNHLGESGSLAADQNPYTYWLLFRSISERFGSGGEDVLQETWERLSQDPSISFAAALDAALAKPGRGVSLGSAFNDYALAVRFNKACGGSFALPYCFAAATRYATDAQTGPAPTTMGTISSIGGSLSRTVRDMAVSWIRLPGGSSAYSVAVRNDDFAGTMRLSVACDLGTSLRRTAAPGTAGPQQTASVAFDPSGCASGSVYAVVTNETFAGSTAARPFTISVAAVSATAPSAPAAPTASAGNASATVSWTAPASGGAPITGYVVTPYAGSSPLDPVHVDSPDTTTLVKWLANGTAHTFRVQARNSAGLSPMSPHSGAVTPSGSLPAFDTTGRFTPLEQPLRILDTRDGTGRVGGATAPMAPGATLDLQITRRAGMPAEAEAVVMNVTAVPPTSGGWLAVYPRGMPRPLVSNLNFGPDTVVPNLVEVPVGYAGWVSIHNSGGSHVIADVAGYVVKDSEGTSKREGLYRPLTPSRLLDTRAGAPLGPGQVGDLQVAGRGGVPASGASAAVLNVTVTQPSAHGWLSAFPSPDAPNAPVPWVSNLNFTPGQTVPNRVVVRLSHDGWVSFFNAVGSTHVIVDVAGWFTDPSATHATTTGIYHGLPPRRIVDTRPGSGQPYAGQTLAPRGVLTVDIAGAGGVPPATAAIKPRAAVLNVTVTNTSSGGWLTVYPGSGTRPLASDLNWVPGLTVANMVVATLDANGRIRVYNDTGSTDVIVDVVGWYS
ncbi:MAG TPA: fibronectin type III domain-containing protein [Actinomycetota bacterium]|nr:fibronectin type III domain-containing protein [Actinomycetota bacterium]